MTCEVGFQSVWQIPSIRDTQKSHDLRTTFKVRASYLTRTEQFNQDNSDPMIRYTPQVSSNARFGATFLQNSTSRNLCSVVCFQSLKCVCVEESRSPVRNDCCRGIVRVFHHSSETLLFEALRISLVGGDLNIGVLICANHRCFENWQEHTRASNKMNYETKTRRINCAIHPCDRLSSL
jgi:hypothetical protein